MRIRLTKITIRDLFEGYDNQFENGVTGFGGKLDIRPKFQREFVYNPIQRDSVIDTVMNGYPLSVMYWLKNKDSDTYELMDGQQRTISICEYVEGSFAVNNEYFFKLPQEKQEAILNYPLLIYVVEEGTDEENLAWFRKINTAGEKLTEQEIRNAVHVGAWTTDAKKYFSKSFCPAIKLGENYLTGMPLRQDYLETVLRWISDDKIDEYMATHANDADASELWGYFEKVIAWIKQVFPTYHKEMKGVEWGLLYNKYSSVDTTNFEARFNELYADDEVESKRGIYYYLFDGDEKHLGISTFTPGMTKTAYKRQNGKCCICGNDVAQNQAIAVRLDSWKDGGRIESENCRVVCPSCNFNYMNKGEDVEIHYMQRDPENWNKRTPMVKKFNRKQLLIDGLGHIEIVEKEEAPKA